MNKTHVYRFNAPPEKVAAVMADIEFHLEMDRTRDDTAETKLGSEERRGDDLTFVMLTKEYIRTKTGKIDRSGTTDGRTRFEWKAGPRTLDWVYTPGQEAGRVDVRGRYRVEPDGSGTRLVHDYTIDIRIPIIGRGIAKIVDREFSKAFPRFEATVKRYIQQMD